MALGLKGVVAYHVVFLVVSLHSHYYSKYKLILIKVEEGRDYNID